MGDRPLFTACQEVPLAACLKCGFTGYIEGRRCVVCGHLEGERLELPPEPEGEDPHGPDREYCCRYCDHVAPSARSLEEHQEARHVGVGRQKVSDARWWWWAR